MGSRPLDWERLNVIDELFTSTDVTTGNITSEHRTTQGQMASTQATKFLVALVKKNKKSTLTTKHCTKALLLPV